LADAPDGRLALLSEKRRRRLVRRIADGALRAAGLANCSVHLECLERTPERFLFRVGVRDPHYWRWLLPRRQERRRFIGRTLEQGFQREGMTATVCEAEALDPPLLIALPVARGRTSSGNAPLPEEVTRISEAKG
jgi:hypothetical protein